MARAITFYSYKGGVGRSLLLAWCAKQLAARGKRVLAIDLDLEAPGLHFKFDEALARERPPTRGVVDLLRGYLEGNAPPEDLAEWCQTVDRSQSGGAVQLLAAGAVGTNAYFQQVSHIAWDRLFHQEPPIGVRFFLWLREALEAALAPDVMLIDARTGVTEMGAAALSLLADHVVAITTPSAESRQGVKAVLQAMAGQAGTRESQTKEVTLVISRLPALFPVLEQIQLLRTIRDELSVSTVGGRTPVSIAAVLPIHSDDALLVRERQVLAGPVARVSTEYANVLRSAMGEPLPRGANEAQGTVRDLRAEALELQFNVVDEYRRNKPASEEFARSLGNLALMLSNSGRRTEAVDFAREAVEVTRQLAADRPAIFEPELVVSLSNLSAMLSELGQPNEALPIAEESTALCRRLVASDPERFESELASSLNNLGNALSEVGRVEDALLPNRESVEIRRRLARSNQRRYQPELAKSIINLSNRLRELGHGEESLALAKEVVEIYRLLANSRRDLYLPQLALSLVGLGSCYRAVQRSRDAIKAIEEAVAIYREFKDRDFGAFAPYLAVALNNYGSVLGEAGSHEDALVAAQQSVEIRRELARTTPGVFDLHLALSLNNLSTRLRAVKMTAEAKRAAEESLHLYVRALETGTLVHRLTVQLTIESYLALCRDAGIQPNNDLIGRAEAALPPSG